MLRTFRFSRLNRSAWFSVGLLAGVVVGSGMAVSLAWKTGTLATTPLYATATHGTESVTMATGSLEVGLEAVVVLDHVTGELTGYVTNPNNGKFFARYTYANVNGDLQLAKGKNPKYTVTTAAMPFKPSGTNRLGQCVIYVAEETSGNIVAYGIPWNPGKKSSNDISQGNFVKLDTAKVGTGVRRS
jgi:hypothetical protein